MRSTLKLIALSLTALFAAPFTSNSHAAIKTETIEYKQGDTVLKGVLTYDDANTDKRPGILVVHEWWGCNDYAQSRAKQLAEMGYVAFACDMYGNGQTTTDPQKAGQLAGEVRKDPRVWLDRAAAGLKVLSDHKLVDSNKLGAIGYCFGGTTCLQMACDGQNLKAVVSFHGSLFTPKPNEAKSIKGTILVCNGAADTFISPDDRKGFVDALEAAKVDYIFSDYAGAVHAFTNPDAGKAGMKGVAYDEKADKRSWANMKQVFDEAFGAAGTKRGALDAPPAILTHSQIAAMNAPTATAELQVRRQYSHPGMYEETGDRLAGECARLEQQLEALQLVLVTR